MAGHALINARVHTMQQPEHIATALAWDGGRIVAVGSDADIQALANAHEWPVQDMDGRVVIPGFIDSHMHFLHVGIKRTRPDLRGAASKQEALDRVRLWLAAHPGDGAVTGEGWDEAEWHGDAPPAREELDQIAGDRPLVLRRICGHKAVANGAALPLVQSRWDDERVDPETGVLLEEPSLYLNEVLPADDATLDAAVDAACRIAHALGVTTVGDYEQAPLRDALLRAARDQRLTVRVQCSIYAQQLEAAIQEGFRTGRPVRAVGAGEDAERDMEIATAVLEGARPGSVIAQDGSPSHPDVPAATGVPVTVDRSSMLRDGGLKVFLDGSLGGHTALMLEPYDDRPETRGRAIWSDHEVRGLFELAHDNGIQIHAHAIGDGAIEQGLQAFEAMAGHPEPRKGDGEPLGIVPHGDPAPDPDERTHYFDGLRRPHLLAHRFEHYEIAHPEQVTRTAALGLWSSSQPNFVGAWSSKGGMYEERIGQRFWLNNRFRSFAQAGLRVCFGSDGMPFGPLYGLQSAIDHPMEAERLSAAEAVYLYTAAGAEAMGRHDVGVVDVGRHADLLVLNVRDLDEAPPKQWIIQETILGGETVHRGDAPLVRDDDVR